MLDEQAAMNQGPPCTCYSDDECRLNASSTIASSTTSTSDVVESTTSPYGASANTTTSTPVETSTSMIPSTSAAITRDFDFGGSGFDLDFFDGSGDSEMTTEELLAYLQGLSSGDSEITHEDLLAYLQGLSSGDDSPNSDFPEGSGSEDRYPF